MFRTPSRRRLAREALDRLEQREAGARLGEEGALAELARLQARDVELGKRMRAMQQRLDDANAELRRWGLEPVLREEAESDEHPTRYRRSSDWRLTDFEHVTAAIKAIAPDGVDVEIDDRVAVVPRAEPAEGDRRESNADLVAQIRLALELARDGLTTDHAYNPEAIAIEIDRALARLNPDDPMCIVSGEVHDGLVRELGEQCDAAHALRHERGALAAAVATLTAERDALREELERATGLADALAEERTEREQAERSRDRAQALNLDLQRWREKERGTLEMFVAAMRDAASLGRLHADLEAPYERAVALLAEPDA